MYHELLTEIAAQTSHYGDAMQPPASPTQINRLRERLGAELNAELPVPYAEFLTQYNGLDWNGLTVYATDTLPIVGYADRFITGCVEANLLRRDHPHWLHSLILAETGDEDWCLQLSDGSYCEIDSVSGDCIRRFSSFPEMMHEALRERL